MSKDKVIALTIFLFLCGWLLGLITMPSDAFLGRQLEYTREELTRTSEEAYSGDGRPK